MIKQKIVKLYNDAIDHIFGKRHKCEACGSYDVKYSGRWTRGWNHYCNQAYGDWGSWCNKCHHITWDTTMERHIETLPKWCTPYPNKPAHEHTEVDGVK